MNPFLNASLSDLRAMVPDLSNPELDALCAAACDGSFVWLCDGTDWLFWGYEGPPDFTGYLDLSGEVRSYTTDGREAMRLMVKYRIDVMFLDDYEGHKNVWAMIHRAIPNPLLNADPLRAITEAAVVCRLTQMIEEDTE